MKQENIIKNKETSDIQSEEHDSRGSRRLGRDIDSVLSVETENHDVVTNRHIHSPISYHIKNIIPISLRDDVFFFLTNKYKTNRKT